MSKPASPAYSPVIAKHSPAGLQYMLPDETREHAIQEIHRLAAANME